MKNIHFYKLKILYLDYQLLQPAIRRKEFKPVNEIETGQDCCSHFNVKRPLNEYK